MGIEKEESIDLEQIVADEAAENEQLDDQGGDEIQLTATEQEAYDQGWRPQVDFDGPEDNWKTAKEYVRDGKFLATIKELSQKVDNQAKEFDSRLDNSNKLHEARRKQEISDLKKEQREAVRSSDTEAYDDAQVKIDGLEKEEVKAEPVKNEITVDPVIDAWETKNPWIHDKTDEKTPIAQGLWNSYLNKHPDASNKAILDHVDDKMGKLYPTGKSNPRRDQPNTTESPSRRGKQASKSLSMNDLTNSEKNEWQQLVSFQKR